MLIIIATGRERLSVSETKQHVETIEKWFNDNRRRRVCNVDFGGVRGKIRRKSVKADMVEKFGTDY